jgi:quinol monooxygenase YgiN
MLRGWLSLLTRPSPALRHRRFALVFQATDDPDRLLYLAEWASRAAFDARAEESGSRAWVREHAHRVDVSFPELVHLVEKAGVPVHVAELARLRVPAAARDAVEAYLRDEATIGFADPHFAVRAFYTDPTISHDLLVYRGWASPAGLDAYRGERGPAIEAWLREQGVSLGHFRGYARVALHEPVVPRPDV